MIQALRHRADRPDLIGRRLNPVRLGLLSFALGWALLAVLPEAEADYWYEHYARAETAIEDGEWSQAVEELQQALERKGDSGARVRSYGMKVVAYFPYLKLGIAYYHLGQIDAALQAFQTEEQLGAVQDSRTAFADLEHYRGLALQARESAASAESDRISDIVHSSLREAEILEQQGRLEAAMEALGSGLAVDPENSAAVARMEALRLEVVRRDRVENERARAADLVNRGRQLLDRGNFAEAASLFQQAQALQPSDEAQQLLARARTSLADEMRANQDFEDRRNAIGAGLAEATSLHSSGRLVEALDRLQPVLAADPENRDALAFQQLLLDEQQASLARGEVADLLARATSEFSAGRFEAAISAANQVLAVDPGNTGALGQIRQSYGEISRRLLGSRTIENIPPAIRFADSRIDEADGSRVELVQRPEFRLSGVVIDNSPVDIRFVGPTGAPIESSSSSQPVGEIFITEFSLDDALDGGPSTYQLIATDSAGLSSSAEYTVVYTEAFYRKLWFQLGIALIPIGVLAGVWTRRIQRRRQLMKRRFNPYIAGAPVLDNQMFFGREQLIERILQTVHNNSLLLYGERRIGKTSLQHHLRKRLLKLDDPQYEFFPVYVDLQGTPEDHFFATLAEDVFHELAPLLGEVKPQADLSDGSDYGYRELVRDLRRILKQLKTTTDKHVKIVLLIDEVDELNAYDPRVNQRLRSLFMKSFAENLVAVVSGVEIRKQWDKEGSPWYNFFEEIEITSIGRDDTEALITRPILGVFKIEDGVSNRIAELTDNKPYRVQRLCISLVNRLYEEGRRTITVADVEAVNRDQRA